MATDHFWTKKSFLGNILKKQNHVDNLQVSISPLPFGENFTSSLYKIMIIYENSCKNTEEISLIIKCHPDNEVLLDYVKTMKLFENEINMYGRVLPHIYNLEYVKKLSATSVYASLTPKPTLILEDLTKQGYKMVCRHNGLDLPHCLLVIEKLAYLHASSIAVSNNKELLSSFNLGIFWNNPHSVRWITIGVESLIETCKKFTHLEKYAQKLLLLGDKFLDKSFEVTRNDTCYNVLNHGDCWVNNLMFSYHQDGTAKDVLLVDLQECIYSSLAVDLHYFWATSPNSDVLTKHLKYILNYYYDEFSRNLQKLKISEKVLGKNEIEEEFKLRAFHGLTALVTTVAFVKSSRRPDASLQNYYEFSGEGSFRYDCFNNERYIERISHLLPFYEKLGVFN